MPDNAGRVSFVRSFGVQALEPQPCCCVEPCGRYLVCRPSAEPHDIRKSDIIINNYNRAYIIIPLVGGYFRSVTSQILHTALIIRDNMTSVVSNALIFCRLSGGGHQAPLFQQVRPQRRFGGRCQLRLFVRSIIFSAVPDPSGAAVFVAASQTGSGGVPVTAAGPDTRQDYVFQYDKR